MKRVICCTIIFLFHSLLCGAGELKGKISAVDAKGSTIEISGVKINATRASIKNLIGLERDISQLKVGDRVEVDGIFSGPGEMVATEIDKEMFQSDQIEGTLEMVDGDRRTLFIAGITITVSDDARIKGQGGKVISINDLVVGDQVECRGSWAGSKLFSSTRIELD